MLTESGTGYYLIVLCDKVVKYIYMQSEEFNIFVDKIASDKELISVLFPSHLNAELVNIGHQIGIKVTALGCLSCLCQRPQCVHVNEVSFV